MALALDLPDAPEWKAKMELADLVKNSPLLAGRIHFYCYSENDPFSDADPDNLPKPFVRLHIRPRTSSWWAAGIHKFPFDLVCELGVDGIQDRPLLALWHAVRLALSPKQPAPGGAINVRGAQMAPGITITEFELADYAVANLGKGLARYLYGLGYMRCEMLICT